MDPRAMMGGPDSRPQDSRLGPGPGQDPRLGPQGPRVQVQDPRLMSPQDPRARPDSHGSQDPRARPDSHGSQDPRARPDSHGSSHSTESKGGREKSVAEHIS